MALQYATSSSESNQIKGDAIYEAKETLESASTGNTILLPDGTGRFRKILVAFILTAGGGKFQFTYSNRADVIAGDAVWFDSADGAVVASITDELYHVSAIRQINTSGTTTLEIRWV